MICDECLFEREEKRVTKPWASPMISVSSKEEREWIGRLGMKQEGGNHLRYWYWWIEWPVIWLNQLTSPWLFVKTKWLSVTTHLDNLCCPWISINWTPENRSWQVIVLESTLTIRLSNLPSDDNTNHLITNDRQDSETELERNESLGYVGWWNHFVHPTNELIDPSW